MARGLPGVERGLVLSVPGSELVRQRLWSESRMLVQLLIITESGGGWMKWDGGQNLHL